ncbi:MAG: hypothetical protein IK115_05815 [Lachnospiraceae bacterium]|nr:hypothetical protein [Lachnospiraceae bacterium]
MKKLILLMSACIFISACLLGGCGKSRDDGAETPAILTSDWELVEYTVKGSTTKAEELDPEVRAIAPAFRCEDGTNCVVSNNGKDHPGTITKENDQYVIRFDDTDEIMNAQISGKTLTMVNGKGTVTFVFRTE